MRLLLIRHGETVDNVAGVYAGITDSALTNHGVLQASRLGAHLSATNVRVVRLFSSDLQRAVKTAEAIRDAQSSPPPETTKLEILREQDFGFYEGKKTIERPHNSTSKGGKDVHAEADRNEPGFKDIETKESMRLRMGTFVDAHLVQLLHDVPSNETTVVVAHGIILSYLWRAVLKRFHPENVAVARGVQAGENGMSLQYLGGWSNTGYLDLEITSGSRSTLDQSGLLTQTVKTTADSIQSSSEATNLPTNPTESCPSPSKFKSTPKLLDMSLVVKAVNSQEHLKGLKKTRGGLGSLKHDSTQKTMHSFFKKRRIE